MLDKVNLSYKIRGNSVTIFENRARGVLDMKEWTSMAIAQIRYDGKIGNGLSIALTEMISGMNITILIQRKYR